MATKAKLHGKPLHLAEQVRGLYDKRGDSSASRRSCRKELAKLVYEMATQTNVEPKHFADYVPNSIVEAIARERTNAKLQSCGVVSIAKRPHRQGSPKTASGRRNMGRLAAAA